MCNLKLIFYLPFCFYFQTLKNSVIIWHYSQTHIQEGLIFGCFWWLTRWFTMHTALSAYLCACWSIAAADDPKEWEMSANGMQGAPELYHKPYRHTEHILALSGNGRLSLPHDHSTDKHIYGRQVRRRVDKETLQISSLALNFSYLWTLENTYLVRDCFYLLIMAPEYYSLGYQSIRVSSRRTL